MMPDEPTSAPAMMSTWLSIAKPVAPAEMPRVRVEERDDDRHVGAADGNHEQDPKDEGQGTQQQEEHGPARIRSRPATRRARR